MESFASKRKRNRLIEYDYSAEGYYFVTICTKDKKKILSTVGVALLGDPNLKLTRIGNIAKENIENCSKKIKNVRIDEYIIMPNHIHLIIELTKGSPRSATPTLSQIINAYKSIVSKQIGYSIWQRNFYEHIIRNEKEYLAIKEYIINNPVNWIYDKYF